MLIFVEVLFNWICSLLSLFKYLAVMFVLLARFYLKAVKLGQAYKDGKPFNDV